MSLHGIDTRGDVEHAVRHAVLAAGVGAVAARGAALAGVAALAAGPTGAGPDARARARADVGASRGPRGVRRGAVSRRRQVKTAHVAVAARAAGVDHEEEGTDSTEFAAGEIEEGDGGAAAVGRGEARPGESRRRAGAAPAS